MRKYILTGLIIAFSVFGFILIANAETITKPYTFVDGTPAVASEVNANFDTVYDQVNKVGSVLTIDSINGRIGIGTTEPVAQLETSGEGSIVNNFITAYGTPISDESIAPVFVGRRARGSATSPYAVQSGDVLGFFGGKGYYGSAFPELATGGMRVVATENHNETNQGTNLTFFTTSNGETSRQASMRISSNGNVGIGTTNPHSKLQVNGYTQLALTAGVPPPAADCDDSSEHGRMKVDEINGYLYICIASGWTAK